MTDEEIRIAIAEACGWSNVKVYPRSESNKRHSEDTEQVCLGYRGAGSCSVPNYPECLNEMHEAFGSMDPWLQIEFPKNLLSVYRSRTGTERTGAAAVDLLHADARHWAEAFLRTLNLWKD